MTKTSSFRKCIATLAMLATSFVFALAFMCSPAVAQAEIVGKVNDIGSNFNSSIAGFTVVNDSNEANVADVAYTVTHSMNYSKNKFGELPASLTANKTDGYAIIKTSPKAGAQPVSAGLMSASFTLNMDSFYRISVDVNAQSESIYGGAVIELASDNESIYFKNGNNSFITTNGEWNKYSIFVATSQFENMDVAINLTLGIIGGTPCLGYAAFDNLEIDLIDYAGFESVLEMYQNGNLPSSYVEDMRKDTQKVEDFDSVKYTSSNDIYTQSISVDGPFSSEKDGNTAIKISNKENDVSAYGVVEINKNDPISFEKVTSTQNGFYLVTVYTKGEDFSGTASLSLNYKSINSVADKYKTFSVAAITDNTNACHNNWRKNYFIIKSSVVSESIGFFTVEYGNESSLCKGSILIDDIEIVSIDFSEYGKYSSDLTTASVVCDFDSSLDDTTGINGAFYQLRTDYYDDLRPNLWSITTQSEDIEYKLVSKESCGYSFSDPAFELDANNPIGNVVKIASDTETIFNIDSQIVEFEATDDVSYYKVTILAASKNISGAGFATFSLVDTNGSAHGAIKISGTNSPTLYTFNIKAKDSASFYIRCSMGDSTYGNNLGGKGELYIARISYAKSTKEDYTEKFESNNSETINFYYDNFNDFTLYNKHDVNDVKSANERIATLKNNSNGEARHGIVELDKVNVAGHEMASTTLTPGYPTRPELDPYLFGSERLKRTYGFVVNGSNATLTINQQQTMSLPAGDETDEETNASSYYKVIISARVIVTGDYGLTIGLINTSSGEVIAQITDIRDTRLYEEFSEGDVGEPKIIRDQFVDFEFYVKLNDSNVSYQIFMTLGGLDKHTQKTSGFVLFQGYQLTPSHEAAYEAAVANTKDGAFYFDNTTETYKYCATKDLSVVKSTGKTTATTTYNANDTWYLIPSILFGVLILVAVIGFFLKKLTEKIKEKREKKVAAQVDNTPAYAKRIDYSRIPDKNTTADTKNNDKPDSDANIDEFDEDYDMYAVHEIKAPTKKKETVEKETLPDELSDNAQTEAATEEKVEEPAEEKVEAVEEKKEEPEKNKVEKPESDEFDD